MGTVMGAGDGAAFGALAAKVNELGQTCARLSQENAELRDRVSQLSGEAGQRGSRPGLPARWARAAVSPVAAPAGSDSPSGSGPGPASVSRRMIGKALGAAAAGAVGAVALTDLAAAPAQAANGDTVHA